MQTTQRDHVATPEVAKPISFFNQLLQVLVAPAQGMATVPQQGARHWLVLLLICVLSAAVQWQMFSNMSPQWLVDQQMLMLSHQLTPAEQEQTRAYLAQTADKAALFAVIMLPLFMLIINAILAGYLKLTGRLQNQLSYDQWFALTNWSQLPMLVCMLGTAVLLWLADSPNVPLNIANFASLNQLVLGLSPEAPLYGWAEALSLFVLWQAYIIKAALQSAAGYSTQRALWVTAAPLVVIFGLWALLA